MRTSAFLEKCVTDTHDIASVPSDKRLADLSKLLDVSRAMTAKSNIDELLAFIIGETTRVMDADRSSLFIVDHAKNELWSRIAEGAEVKEIRFPFGVGIAGHVAASKETVNITDAYSDERFNPEFDKKTGYKTETVLCQPLLNFDGKVIGVVQVLNKKGGTFGGYDEFLLGAFAAQAAVTLEKQILIEEYLEKQRIQESLNIAHDIQQGLLPKENPVVENFDIAGWNQPCDETGGDYSDFVRLPSGRLGIVLGDVTGHGIGSALLMASSRASLRALMKNIPGIDRGLFELNNTLEEDMEEEKFMTLFYGELDPATNELRYASAGHDSPLWYSPGRGEFTELESTGLPLGMFEDTDYGVSPPMPLAPGDVMFIATDGIWEAMNARKEQFGIERLKAVLVENCAQPAPGIIETVRRAVFAFMDGAKQRDDLTAVVIKVL